MAVHQRDGQQETLVNSTIPASDGNLNICFPNRVANVPWIMQEKNKQGDQMPPTELWTYWSPINMQTILSWVNNPGASYTRILRDMDISG